MNLQIHHVISDSTGLTGLRIIDSILAGEREPETLAKLRDHRIRASQETLCPDNDVSGGKKLSAKTRQVGNRAAWAFKDGRHGSSQDPVLAR